MGRILARHGRPEEAIAHWRRVRDIDPDSSYHRGVDYFHLGLGHFMRRQSNIEVGRILESLGRTEDAAAEYRAQLASEPMDAEVLGRLALVEVELGRFTEAVETLERYAALRPDDGSGSTTGVSRGSSCMGCSLVCLANRARGRGPLPT